MPEKILQTRIQILNDTAEALAAQGTAVPKAGEIVYENDTRKMKIGDGSTSYADLKYFGGDSAKNFDVVPNDGEEDVVAITRVVASAEVHTGDTAIVKRVISGDKTSYTAYVYDGEWKAIIAPITSILMMILLILWLSALWPSPLVPLSLPPRARTWNRCCPV